MWPSLRPIRLSDGLRLWKLIDTHRPECLIANFGSVNWMCLIGWLRSVRCRIAWYHTLSTQIASDTKLSPMRLRVLRLRKRFVYRWATHVATNSRAALEDINRVFGVPISKCNIWPNTLPDPSSWLRTGEARSKDDLIVCAGRLEPTKGQDVLIEALARCVARRPSLRVEFFGGGSELDRLQAQASKRGVAKRCAFLGSVPHAEVLRKMASAKVCVVPSRSEAFGLINIESMSVGTPLVASRVGGIPEIIRDGVDGFLVPPDDPDALTEKILFLLENPDLRQQMGRDARQRFLADYEQSKVIAKQADWLERITH